MLGKRFQRTTSMAHIGPAGNKAGGPGITDESSGSRGKADLTPPSDQDSIGHWDILKRAEEMMMMMMNGSGAGDSRGGERSPSTAAAEVSNFAVQSHDAGAEAAGSMYRASFLENCHFCKRRLKPGRDIFIYRGDSAFCTEECRQRQILKDEMRADPKKGRRASASPASETAVAA
ncbi:hypothetical protein KP509_30G019400 [Ceratopteris richardii]|uniref:FLZ-type domain-containing protein n=1 Tax=Ceratopteris richardii TaxID=49495 RepID=A0A8T2R2F6_CERRI|nr:hypothetical protein KP509_30G019400 [Ceratopteris richardii]